MKTALVCAIVLSFAATAYSTCMTCAKGPVCKPVSKDCTGGEGRCVSASGTVNGVKHYLKDCAFANRCENCSNYFIAIDCNNTCCAGKNCNTEPFPVTIAPDVVSTDAPSGNATSASPTSGNQTQPTTKPVVKAATTESPAGIVLSTTWALVSLVVFGFLGNRV